MKCFTEVVMLELHGEGLGKFPQREEVGKGIAERGKSMGYCDRWQTPQHIQETLILHGSA